MAPKTVALLALALLASSAAAQAAAAQAAAAQADAGPSAQQPRARPCDGEIVHAIDVRPGRPPFSGAAAKWRTVARSFGLHHATSQAEVVRAFLALHVGQVCTERRRSESERILRAQGFIADARVTTTHDSLGQLVVHVETVDEVPALVGARFHGVGFPRALSLGNANVAGAGMLVESRFERKTGYRTGFGARLVAATTFDHPYRFTIDGDRQSLGHQFLAEFEHPLFTDLQHIAWHASYRSDDEFVGIARPADDPLAIEFTQERWDGSAIVRVFGGRTITVVGFAASRLHLVPADSGILVTPQGLRPDTGIALRGRYTSFAVTRAGLVTGARQVRFTTVTGFDGLFATQDLASGFMVGVLAAKSLPAFGEQDAFLSSSAYAGIATARTFLGAAIEAEGRRNDANRWDSMIASGRLALYLKTGRGFDVITSDEFSGGSHSRLPLQLSFSDLRGGLRGYGASTLAGAQRNVIRTEVRGSKADVFEHADLGVALFTDMGQLWAGDAPYGVTAPGQSVGVSLLAAYPTGSKRLYRLDIGVPLRRDNTTPRRLELRVTSEDRTSHFWEEPADVHRARTGATAPSTLFGWQ